MSVARVYAHRCSCEHCAPSPEAIVRLMRAGYAEASRAIGVPITAKEVAASLPPMTDEQVDRAVELLGLAAKAAKR